MPFAQIISKLSLKKPADAHAPVHASAQGHGHGHGPLAKDGEKERRLDARDPLDPHDPLDPETRRCAQMAPPAFTTPPAPAPPPPDAEIAPRARVSMEELLPQLVKRIAWAGDKRRGSVQMELGAGPHAGTVITVHADDGRVRVELAGDDSGALRERLRSRGFDVDA